MKNQPYLILFYIASYSSTTKNNVVVGLRKAKEILCRVLEFRLGGARCAWPVSVTSGHFSSASLLTLTHFTTHFTTPPPPPHLQQIASFENKTAAKIDRNTRTQMLDQRRKQFDVELYERRRALADLYNEEMQGEVCWATLYSRPSSSFPH